jgi:hypothetical protein
MPHSMYVGNPLSMDAADPRHPVTLQYKNAQHVGLPRQPRPTYGVTRVQQKQNRGGPLGPSTMLLGLLTEFKCC